MHSSQKIIKLSLMFLCLVIISNSLLGFEMIENKSQAKKYFQMQKLRGENAMRQSLHLSAFWELFFYVFVLKVTSAGLEMRKAES